MDYLLSIQLQRVNLPNNLRLPLVEQQVFVVLEIAVAAVFADEPGGSRAEGQLCDQDEQLMLLGEYLFTERKHVFQLNPGTGGGFFELSVLLKLLVLGQRHLKPCWARSIPMTALYDSMIGFKSIIKPFVMPNGKGRIV